MWCPTMRSWSRIVTDSPIVDGDVASRLAAVPLRARPDAGNDLDRTATNILSLPGPMRSRATVRVRDLQEAIKSELPES